MEIKESQGKFPKAVPFVLASVFFDRFCSGGIFAILAIFLNQKLGFDSNMSTALYHINEFILYFFAIFGAIIADSWLGSFKTILWTTVLFALGSGIVAIASIDSLELPLVVVSLFGLFIFVIASGGLKTNQSVFGGNQFKLPEQENQLNRFFSIQYFVLKCGVLLGQILIPVLRNDVKCFGMDNCFPLAFGVPAISMLLLFVILLSGRSFYTHMPPSGNMFVKVSNCVVAAIKNRFTRENKDLKCHWLDYAVEKHGEKLVSDTKLVLSCLKIFLTMIVFSALFSQNSSRFVFQATRMNGDLGFYTIKPDQMMVFMTLFTITMVPVLDYIIYPLLSKIGIKTLFHKITCGYVCAALAFVAASIVELKIEESTTHMLWLLPQFCIIAVADIFVWVSITNLAYTQSPERMKSVMSSFVYLMVACGSLIVTFVSATNLLKSQALEFLMYSGLMGVNVILFVIISKDSVLV